MRQLLFIVGSHPPLPDLRGEDRGEGRNISSHKKWQWLNTIQIANQFIDRGNVISAGSPAPIFPLDDVSQFQQIFRRRRIIIRPLSFARKLRLKTPDTAKFCRTDLSLLPLSIFLCPYVLTRHRGKILH